MVRYGGCLCGAIRYRAEDEPSARGLCHCTTCRKAASAPSLPFSTFRQDQVTILQGTPAAFRSSPQVVRSFCATCGSPLSYVHEGDPDSIDLMTCSFDAPDALPPEFSVWTSEKLAWDQPNPSCPAFPRRRSDAADG